MQYVKSEEEFQWLNKQTKNGLKVQARHRINEIGFHRSAGLEWKPTLAAD